MSIPKIIHQTAPTNEDDWHPLWFKCRQSWKDQYPEFEHRMWNDEEIDDLVRQHYPQYYDTYLEFPLNIMRIDFARVCILHEYGGIYADMDVYCYKNFYNELKKELCFGGEVININHDWFPKCPVNPFFNTKVSNYIMCSTKSHSFWISYADYIVEQISKYIAAPSWSLDKKSNSTAELVVKTSGPYALLKSLLLAGEFDKVQILDCNRYNFSDDMTLSVFTQHINTHVWNL